jgi:serine/threonine protein kinase
MDTIKNEDDPYIGVDLKNGYIITEYVNSGKIGSIYKAVNKETQDVLACKVIKKLKDGWEKEILKVVRLRGIPNIVPYHTHGSGLDKKHQTFVWVLWDYIKGIDLRQYMQNPPWKLDMAFIEDITKTILRVLHACRVENIQHGDLHEGNILLGDPDPRLPGNPRTIWISDFGYGGSHNQLEPRDDFRQLFSIASTLLKKLKPSELNPRDRVMYQKMDEFLKKKIMEVDPTQGVSATNVGSLFKDFNKLAYDAEKESAAAARGDDIKRPGDYLAAEALGNRGDEWRNLFVPEFLAAQDLLSKNVTILTGARGCGKTMAFKRLTAFMDKVIGEPSGVKGSDQFVGFYLNCRDLAEAFPWLPDQLKQEKQRQIISFFHLAWFSEVLKTLAVYKEGDQELFEWLDIFLLRIFGKKYHSLPQGADILAHARSFIENEKESCRQGGDRKTRGHKKWPLSRLDFLKILQHQLEVHVPWIGQTPLFFFLDDYTIPTIPRQVQVILNPIIFSRHSKLFFKISSESTNSFDRQGVRGKPLELSNDFELIDLATESLHQDKESKEILLDKIFKPRIERYELFRGRNLHLKDVLGRMSLNSNELAKLMRNNLKKKGKKKKVIYHGEEAFVGMWSSDIRVMIKMFTDMLRDAKRKLEEDDIPVNEKIQDKIYRATGGEFLESMGSLIDPFVLEKGVSLLSRNEKHGVHLKDIVEAFVKVSRYELTNGNLVKNQGKFNPKQAFRVEIIDKFEMTPESGRYLESLIRWHIFLQDWRGKSVRGMLTPRLYLNRILLPFCYLTFSMHDNIHLTNKEFIDLLTKPKEFFSYWKKEKKKHPKTDDGHQTSFEFAKSSKGGEV